MKKNGFTLIELIAVIAIIGTLSIVVGINSARLTKDSYKKNYYQTFKDLFDSASVYSELSTVDCENGCTITLNSLVSKGLVESTIYDKTNPLFKEKNNFTNQDKFIISFENGKKKIVYKSGSCIINFTDLKENYNWEAC